MKNKAQLADFVDAMINRDEAGQIDLAEDTLRGVIVNKVKGMINESRDKFPNAVKFDAYGDEFEEALFAGLKAITTVPTSEFSYKPTDVVIVIDNSDGHQDKFVKVGKKMYFVEDRNEDEVWELKTTKAAIIKKINQIIKDAEAEEMD